MKKLSLCFLCLLVAFSVALAAGFSKTYSLATGTVIVANTQKRSSWVPVAILIHYTAPIDTAITVKRLSEGNEYLLSSISLTDVQDVTWIPEADYSFNYGDSLLISSTATAGTLELIQRSSP